MTLLIMFTVLTLLLFLTISHVHQVDIKDQPKRSSKFFYISSWQMVDGQQLRIYEGDEMRNEIIVQIINQRTRTNREKTTTKLA